MGSHNPTPLPNPWRAKHALKKKPTKTPYVQKKPQQIIFRATFWLLPWEAEASPYIYPFWWISHWGNPIFQCFQLQSCPLLVLPESHWNSLQRVDSEQAAVGSPAPRLTQLLSVPSRTGHSYEQPIYSSGNPYMSCLMNGKEKAG